MGKKYSLKKLKAYLEDLLEQIGKMRQELEEIQIGFNSAYVEWKADHDAALERLTEAMNEDLASLSPEMRQKCEERLEVEKQVINERHMALQAEIIPQAQQAADEALAEGQKLTARLHYNNPRLDAREEQLKAQRTELESQLAELNQQIKEMSGCLKVAFNYFKINKVDRQRQQVIGKLQVIQQELKEIRLEWETIRTEIDSEQADYQKLWQDYTLEIAQLQSEFDFLNDPNSAMVLAQKRAVRNVIDHQKEPIPAGNAALQPELDGMIEFNIQTDDYQAALGAVSGILSLLDGIAEGLRRFQDSVQGLLEEQEMHSSYLSDLEVALDDSVLAFHQHWKGLTKEVQDDAHHSANPNEFVTAVQPSITEKLSEEKIQNMFDSLGKSLTLAAKEWD